MKFKKYIFYACLLIMSVILFSSGKILQDKKEDKVSLCKASKVSEQKITCNQTCLNYHQPSTCITSPESVDIIQPDGTKLTIIGKGNIIISYTETTDGYTILRTKDGFYKYAISAKDGNLVPANIIAHNINYRTFKERRFLQETDPHLRYTGLALENLRAATPSIKKPQYAAKFTTTGTHKVLAILIRYPDLSNTFSKNNFEDMMNQSNYNGTGSFRDYYLDNSFGQLTLNTDVFGWYDATHGYEYYGRQHGNNRARELAAEALDAAEAAGVNFAEYDNDNDGVVDGVVFVHSGPGAEEGSRTQYIWSHRWVLSGSYERTFDGVKIRDYMFNPETRDGLTNPTMVGIGVFCHEFGHGLGLPDLYDTDGSSEGIGNWCLMAGGGWLNSEDTPACMSAWCKMQMGWLSPTILNTQGNFALPPASLNNVAYRVNTVNENEYFLIENRQQQGYDSYLPGHGLAIWHIDDNQYSNRDETHKLVDLEEADGLNHLDNHIGRGDSGDLYPGSSNNNFFNDSSNPDSRLYDNTISDVCIDNITESGTTASFNFSCVSCEPFHIVSYPLNNSADFEASDYIHANNTVAPNINVTFDAGNKVRLQTGFHAKPNSNFHAFIDGCSTALRTTNKAEENVAEVVSIKRKQAITDQVEPEITQGEYGVKVYPNPFNDNLKIDISGNLQADGAIVLFDIDGKLLVEKSFEIGTSSLNLNTAHLQQGMYILKIRIGGEMLSKKLVK